MYLLAIFVFLLTSFRSSTFANPFVPTQKHNPNPILTASFTWNNQCGPTVACGPSFAGIRGQGTTAANNITFAAGKPIVNGKGAGCGQCWHLQPVSNPFPNNGKKFGTPVIAKITDQCTDGGYCDQTESRHLNTGYGKQVHFDLCGDTGTAPQFFGTSGRGVLLGFAQQEPDCSRLNHGTQGSKAGAIDLGSASSDGGGGGSGVEADSSTSADPSTTTMTQSEDLLPQATHQVSSSSSNTSSAAETFSTLTSGNLSLPYRLPGGGQGTKPGAKVSVPLHDGTGEEEEDDDEEGDECEADEETY